MRFITRVLVRIALVGLFAAPSAALAQTPVLVFTPSGAVGPISDRSVGWQFNVVSGIWVNGLSWYDSGVDGPSHGFFGLNVGHTVGIWGSDGSLLASTFVTAGDQPFLAGQFRTTFIAPIFLTPGVGYIVGGDQNFSASPDPLAVDVTSQALVPELQFVHATVSTLGGFQRPTNFAAATTGFYGPSFTTITATPEPGTYALVGTGLMLLAIARRRRASRSDDAAI